MRSSDTLIAIDYLRSEPLAVLVTVGILGLIVGSFLNVVIYRLPQMMLREMREYCAEIMEMPQQPATEPFNLVWPRSRCPHCAHPITALENIPLLSYLWQKGRCTACHGTISIRYPVIEVISTVFAVVTAWQLGFGWALAGALILTWALLALSVIDLDHQLLPDNITLPLIWLGIFSNLFGLYTDLASSVIGAMAGYMILWSVNTTFKLLMHKEGMGAGDFKLLAALGAWLGWQMLPVIILFSSLVGSIVGITLILLKKNDLSSRIPFGPYLAGAGWISLLWGSTLTQYYLTWHFVP